VHVFNEVGTRVWELCDGRSFDAIVDEIVSEFDVERARAASDVRTFAERLVSVGAARITGTRPA
jgi:pyrroloquinoline quinone biosynthesis protein D